MEGTRDKQVSKGEIEETYIHGKGGRGSYGRSKGQGTIKGQGGQMKEVRGKGQGGHGKGKGKWWKGQGTSKGQEARGTWDVWVG